MARNALSTLDSSERRIESSEMPPEETTPPRRRNKQKTDADEVTSQGQGKKDGSSSKKKKKSRKNTPLKRFIRSRRPIQILFGLAIWVALAQHWTTLGVVVIVGSALGIVLGKIFCRWMCPIGLMMDLMMGAGPSSQSNLYMYYKLGCPIAWVSGLLNRFSLLRVRRKEDACVDCGLCDKACYVAQFDGEASLYREGRRNASTFYACSRCFDCVTACPTNALTIGLPTLPTRAKNDTAKED